MHANDLEKLLNTRKVWRASRHPSVGARSLDSGHPLLNQHLPDEGWPTSGLTELLCDQAGIGELGLLGPALMQLSQKQGWIVWIDPPYWPYAPALAQQGIDLSRVVLLKTQSQTEQLWALETLLKATYCHAVLFWPKHYSPKALRRLQVASRHGNSWGIAFRPLSCQNQASPAPLRVRLCRSAQQEQAGLGVEILKRPSAWASPIFYLPIQNEIRTTYSSSDLALRKGTAGALTTL
ncbi:MAG: translesion DNA synthesis-associated protein ImuA [Gammaproteobacteria bacterium]|nr:translesion DNA synthesis-associated protein ImuA [Gammaproteobacteria bacterium]